MTIWGIRFKGQFHFQGGFGTAQYRANSVREGRAGSRAVLELMESNNTNPRAILDLEAVFGYRLNPDSTITVWRRDPTVPDGECYVFDLVTNFIKPGKLGQIETWDLWERENDPNGPTGRFIGLWVSEVWRAA
jgi:hypothetical protein